MLTLYTTEVVPSSQQRVLNSVDFPGTPFFNVGKRDRLLSQYHSSFVKCCKLHSLSLFLLVVLWWRNNSCRSQKAVILLWRHRPVVRNSHPVHFKQVFLGNMQILLNSCSLFSSLSHSKLVNKNPLW